MSQQPDPRPYPFGEQPGLEVHPVYRAVRDGPGLPRVQPPFGRWTYLATRYEDVRFVLSDPRMSRAGLVGEDEPRVHPFITERTALSALDPPEHTRLRRVLMGAFTARCVAALRRYRRSWTTHSTSSSVRVLPPTSSPVSPPLSRRP